MSVLRDCRKAAGLTQTDLAEVLGVTPTAVSYWETGKRTVPLEQIPRLALVLAESIPHLAGLLAVEAVELAIQRRRITARRTRTDHQENRA